MAREANSSVWMYNNEGNAPTIYYSLGSADNWILWDYSTITLANIGDKVYFCGENEYIAHDIVIGWSSPYSTFQTSGKIAASGDVTTLLNPEGVDVLTADFCLAFLFDHSEGLVEAPELPSTTLSEGCYYCMFGDSENLEKAPYLPATNLATDCYKNIFAGCTRLVDVSFNSEAAITETEAENWLIGVSEYGLIYGADSTYDIIYGIPSNWVGMRDRKIFNWKMIGDNYVFAVNGDISDGHARTILGYVEDDRDEDSYVSIYYDNTRNLINYDDDDWSSESGQIVRAFTRLNGTQLWIDFSMESGHDSDFHQQIDITVPAPTVSGVENTTECLDGTVVNNGTGTVTMSDVMEGARIIYQLNRTPEWHTYTEPITLPTGTYNFVIIAERDLYIESNTVGYNFTVSVAEECPTDCTDCNNWEECGYESYDDCRCQQYGECPEERLRIVEKLVNILNGMVADTTSNLASFQYNSIAKGNVRLDAKMANPTALLVQITDWSLDLTNMTKREAVEVSLFFLDKETKIDNEALNQEVIIKRMADIACDFLSRLMADKSLRIVEDKVNVKSVFYNSDSNRDGVCLQMRIEERGGSCL